MKVGAKVKCINKFGDGEEGIVDYILEHDPIDPIEAHGMIQVQITDPGKSKYLKIGDFEHYVHYRWNEWLRIEE